MSLFGDTKKKTSFLSSSKHVIKELGPGYLSSFEYFFDQLKMWRER